ncbi:hypothetical protein [Streptomyces sp. NBC_00691]|uniref:hypothetical protein n=1 Tax=Streptomyces sp. NBC_00691 TaxID=2903671 RepID=UPI002E31C045|nr:hypothetical protein [Streptomyces sp. NBC_00691]
MTFILLTCVPMAAAVLLVQWEPRERRRERRHPARPSGRPVRRRLIHCHLALPLQEALV